MGAVLSLAERRLAAQRALAASFALEDADPSCSQQQNDPLDAACRAGFIHFIRDPNPARADRRYAALADKRKAERKTEFLVQLTAYRAAGGC